MRNFSEEKIKTILQEHKNHLRECKEVDESEYWVGALDCVDVIGEKLGLWIK